MAGDRQTNRRSVLASAVALAGATAGCIIGGEGTPRPTPAQESIEGSPTDEETDDESTGEGSGIDFEVALTDLQTCGRTCRTAFITVENRGDEPASSTSLHVVVTTDGDQIYEDDHDVGDVDARSKREGIKRDVDVGPRGGSKIKSNGGDITIELTPESGEYVGETFTFERTLDV
jgi:hypothetical protein